MENIYGCGFRQPLAEDKKAAARQGLKKAESKLAMFRQARTYQRNAKREQDQIFQISQYWNEIWNQVNQAEGVYHYEKQHKTTSQGSKINSNN